MSAKLLSKNKSGKVIIVIPLTLGVVGAAIAPALAILGTMAALIGECTITVERSN